MGITKSSVTSSLPASNITVDNISGSTYTQLQQFLNVIHSPGLISGGVISNGGGGNASVSAGIGVIRAVDDDASSLKLFNFPLSSLAIPNDSVLRYIGVKYNGGSPIVELRSTENWDNDTEFGLGSAVQVNGILFPVPNPFRVGDPITNIIQRFDAIATAQRDNAVGGLILGETGTRNLTVSAGKIWHRLDDTIIAAKNTATGDFFGATYYNGTSWVFSPLTNTQWPNTQYNDITSGLVDLGTNKYGVLWFYLAATSGVFTMIYGDAQYNNSADAVDSAPPSFVPANWPPNMLLIGRLIFQKSASSAEQIDSAFSTVFSSVPVNTHNDLSGLQGGTSGEYYHLTNAEYLRLPTTSLSLLDTTYKVALDVSAANTLRIGTGFTQLTIDTAAGAPFINLYDFETVVGYGSRQLVMDGTDVDLTSPIINLIGSVIFKDFTDNTKVLTHDVSGITTATTRTVTWPDKNITVAGTANETFTGTTNFGAAVTLLDGTPKTAMDISAGSLRIANGFTVISTPVSTVSFTSSVNLTCPSAATGIQLTGNATSTTACIITRTTSVTSGSGTFNTLNIGGTLQVGTGSTNFNGITTPLTINQTNSGPAPTGVMSCINLNPTVTSVVTSLYGIRLQLAAAPTGGGTAWNLFSDGTAPIHIAGNTGLGTTTVTAGRLNLGAGTTTLAPLNIASGTNKTTSVSGDTEYDGTSLFFTNSGAQRQSIELSQPSRVSTQFDKIDTTLANITGLSATVVAGKTYRFITKLFYDADVVGGSKFTIAGTATATNIIAEVVQYDDASNTITVIFRLTSLGSSVGQAGSTAGLTVIEGTITVNAGGTLIPQFAQNVANGTSSVLIGSTFAVTQVV